MAAPALRRAGWGLAATGAAAVLVALALYGQRPDSGLARFEAAGVMTDIRPGDVTDVGVTAGGRGWHFRRTGAERWAPTDGTVAGDPSEAVEHGLRFLRVSAPQRVIGRDELASSASEEFGLAPPRYVVVVRAAVGTPFVIEFGGPNAQGLAQYARVHGRDSLFLLPRFVGESWETAVGLR